MQGLLRKLASLDSDAERGLRLIEFFDQLVMHRADLEAVVRATAVLAEATAGAVDDRLGIAVSITQDGRALGATGPSDHASVHDVVVDGSGVGRVWLDRCAGSADWDDLILARMALTMAAVSGRAAAEAPPAHLGLADPAVLQVLLRGGGGAGEAEVSRAVRLLGFAPGQLVVPIALAAASGVEEALAAVRTALVDQTGRRVVGTALSDRLAVLLLSAGTTPEPALPPGVVACVGDAVPVERCAAPWTAVRRGVRFAALGGQWSPWQRLSALGAVVVLADVPEEVVQAQPDVQAVDALAARRGGDLDLQLLEAACHLKSVREAAAAVHLHHSSAAYRLDGVEAVLGFEVRTPQGRYRARTALLLWQLHGGSESAR
ncbi:helix-turn-helix domain-containing protein [Kineococcus rhizosphaerae]|nr:helix-turn-helix domain-containing protein [Kineococcus rhizosphaerae]